MKPFEIFRSGTHTSNKGSVLTFSEDDLATLAASYDPTLHRAPIVVGHPKTNAPAYGWVKALKVSGDRLVAVPDQVDPAFCEIVRDGRYAKVSAALYAPDQASNPTPGRYHLRHVGFLGAEPPAIKGLAPVEFSEDDQAALTFCEIEFSSEPDRWAFLSMARVLRRLREHFIETNGQDKADKVLPEWEIGDLLQAANANDQRSPTAFKSFSEPKTGEDMSEQELAQRLADIEAREAALKASETSFSEQARARREAEDATFVASIVEAGRLPVGLKDEATALFAELSDDALTFSEGGEDKTTTPRAMLRNIFERLPVPVVTQELALGDGPDFSDPAHVLVAIETEMQTARERGETLSPAQAAQRLQSRR